MKKYLLAGCFLFAVGGLALFYVHYDEWFLYPKIRAGMAAHLKDPASTQFRNEKFASGILCGELNSKNAMGGYVGFSRYISDGKDLHYLEKIGAVGKFTPEDVDLVMEKELETIKKFVAIKTANPAGEMPTKTEMQEIALQQFFDGRWNQFCKK